MSRTSIFAAVLVVVLLALGDVIGVAVPAVVAAARVKCCMDGFVLSDDLRECVQPADDGLGKIGYQKILEQLDLASNATHDEPLTCFQDVNGTLNAGNYTLSAVTNSISCIDFQKNGSLVHFDCSEIITNLKYDKCDNLFTVVVLYGATMIIFANIIYLIPYVLVFLMYALIPSICRRAYDKAVLCFALTQAILSIAIITLGHFILCHKVLSNLAYSFFGITFMIMTISGVLWLLVISFDVSSTITRFRWAPSSGRDENHKFRVYLTWVSTGTLIPTVLSTILEFLPLSDDFIVKPNFHNINSLNYRVIVHVITVPILGCITSNVLFIYTTVKMISIQKSTSVVNKNKKNGIKEKYILYLKLYLLMDAPYITGALGSIFKDLWILKFVRMLQPIMLLYAVLPRNSITKAFSCRKKSRDENNQTKPKLTDNVEPC